MRGAGPAASRLAGFEAGGLAGRGKVAMRGYFGFEAGAGVNRASRLAAMRSLAARAGAVCACWHGLTAWDPAPVNRVLCTLAGAAPA